VTLFKQTAGVIQSMEEQEEALLEARVARVAVAVVLLEARLAVAATVAQGTVDPDGQAPHQVVPRGQSCR
jgi:hypothetical protein